MKDRRLRDGLLLPGWAERYVIIGLIGLVMTLADRRIMEIERRLTTIEHQLRYHMDHSNGEQR